MATETLSKADDFGVNDVDVARFDEEIRAESGISKTLLGVSETVGSDDVDCEFDQALSAGERTLLEALAAAHVPTPPPPDVILNTSTVMWEDDGTLLYDEETNELITEG